MCTEEEEEEEEGTIISCRSPWSLNEAELGEDPPIRRRSSPKHWNIGSNPPHVTSSIGGGGGVGGV